MRHFKVTCKCKVYSFYGAKIVSGFSLPEYPDRTCHLSDSPLEIDDVRSLIRLFVGRTLRLAPNEWHTSGKIMQYLCTESIYISVDIHMYYCEILHQPLSYS